MNKCYHCKHSIYLLCDYGVCEFEANEKFETCKTATEFINALQDMAFDFQDVEEKSDCKKCERFSK